MKIHRHLPLVALTVLAPVEIARAGAAVPRRSIVFEAEKTDLKIGSDAGLEALRGGQDQVGGPSRVREDERTALRAAEGKSAGLAEMRAGNVGIIAAIVIVILLLLLI